MKRIQVLGIGCPRCDGLADAFATRVRALGVAATVEQVDDIDTILSFDVLLTPAVVLDGRVLIVGRIPSTEEIDRILLAAL